MDWYKHGLKILVRLYLEYQFSLRLMHPKYLHHYVQLNIHAQETLALFPLGEGNTKDVSIDQHPRTQHRFLNAIYALH